MKVKVCGLTRLANLETIQELDIDLLGFIFYAPSPRFVVGKMPPAVVRQSGAGKKKVGVFVDENLGKIIEYAHVYGLDGIQLHGQESPALCFDLREAYTLVKAFPIADKSDFKQTAAYEGACDYFLFDTKGPRHGGNGVAFDWRILEAYQGTTPFLLSGGIGADDAARIALLQHPLLAGVDLNSRFESSPGIKDPALLKSFLKRLRPAAATNF